MLSFSHQSSKKMFKFGVLLFCAAAVTCLPAETVPKTDPRIDVNGNWRIVGGSNTVSGAHPYVVSLRSTANSHFCGGTKLNQMNVLTAAHCIVARHTGNTISVFGTHLLNSGGTTRATGALLIHANYNPTTLANDIAVVRLAISIAPTTLIQPIALNTVNTGAVAGFIIGWGRTYTESVLPNNLQHLPVTTLTHAHCQSSWGSLVTPQQICISSPAGQGACNGDSGGPLLQTSNGAQLGIASFILAGGCGQAFPDVYVRVSAYNGWIQVAVNW